MNTEKSEPYEVCINKTLEDTENQRNNALAKNNILEACGYVMGGVSILALTTYILADSNNKNTKPARRRKYSHSSESSINNSFSS